MSDKLIAAARRWKRDREPDCPPDEVYAEDYDRLCDAEFLADILADWATDNTPPRHSMTLVVALGSVHVCIDDNRAVTLTSEQARELSRLLVTAADENEVTGTKRRSNA